MTNILIPDYNSGPKHFNTFKNIDVFSRQKFRIAAEEYNNPFAAIRITCSNDTFNDILNYNLQNELRLHFDDVSYKDMNICSNSFVYFNKYLAKDIIEFTEECRENNIESLFIHCDMGVSRSAGVAAAISKIYRNSDDFYFKNYTPNMLVYRVILNYYYEDFNE
jgi:predicted protein tyrosine phosphatase